MHFRSRLAPTWQPPSSTAGAQGARQMELMLDIFIDAFAGPHDIMILADNI